MVELQRRVSIRIAEFGHFLRRRGLRATSARSIPFTQALSILRPLDIDAIYWAGRLTFVSREEEIALYDDAFAEFLRNDPQLHEIAWQEADGGMGSRTILEEEETRIAVGDAEDEASTPGGATSQEILRNKRFEDLTPDEEAAIQQAMMHMTTRPPTRRSRRLKPFAKGHRPDLRRSLKASLRSDGEMLRRFWKTQKRRPRPLVFLLDVSGSMKPYSRVLLQFAYAASRRDRQTEVFCFGTTLSRLSPALRVLTPDEAMIRVFELVPDWEGGTRIGESVGTFTKRWGRRGIARGAIVIVCSDGLDRGDPVVLAQEMDRLSRLADTIVWINPLKGHPRYQPLARGMAAALPHIDVFLSGHNLKSLDSLVAIVAE